MTGHVVWTGHWRDNLTLGINGLLFGFWGHCSENILQNLFDKLPLAAPDCNVAQGQNDGSSVINSHYSFIFILLRILSYEKFMSVIKYVKCTVPYFVSGM